MEKLFVYGTLKKGYRNHHYLSGSRFLGKAVTKEKFALYADSVPFLVKSPPISKVKGELYEVDSRTLRNVDALEGHPRVYRRERITVILEDGREAEAWAYFYPSPRGRLLRSGEF